MIKQAPTPGRILLMLAFALSCFGLLLFLWLSFGGAIPLRPKGYQVHVNFPEATTLADEADVRISGVNVGKVRQKKLDERRDVTDVTLDIDRPYAPIPADSRAILRQKTLLGETYVELTPGSRTAPKVPDGGHLSLGNVAPTVELDEIFRAFDAKTRQAFQTWLEDQGRAVNRTGRYLNDALGNLAPFAEDASDALAILDEEHRATRRLVRNTGEVFAALTERRGMLRQLISASNRVFATTAARDRELQETFQVLPTFLDESRVTLRRLTRFAHNTNPLITQLRPAARQLSPTLIELKSVAPDLKALFRDIGPLVTVSRRGLPATSDFLDQTRPLLGEVDPFARNLNPILRWVTLYKKEIVAFFADDAASTQAVDQPPGARHPIHYLRTTNPINPESLAAYPYRIATNRPNPYFEPGGYSKLARGLEVFGKYLCTSNKVPELQAGVLPFLPAGTRELVEQFAFSGGAVPAPPCKEQAPLGRLLGQSGRYPHVLEEPGP